MSRFALVDCNNFYVSCERAFKPALEKKPVVVLSNNDGCIISRSNEAKQLGIPMGAPFFKWEKFCKQNSVAVCSSNYELYGDMSQRIMSLLKIFNEDLEIYSIDEAFLYLNAAVTPFDLQQLYHHIKKSTGIPISIGVSTTKTLAKIANQLAKKRSQGVFYLLEETDQEQYLYDFPVEKIWGIGRRLSLRLREINIDTAKKLRDMDKNALRLQFNVTVEKTGQELNGVSCLQLEAPKNRKQIISSRSFGKIVTELTDLEEAISHYTHIASLKLRKQKCVTSALYVYLQTHAFKAERPQYANSFMYALPAPTADTFYLIRLAKNCLRHIYKSGFQYHKAGVMLMDIAPQQFQQYDFLLDVNHKNERTMQAVDRINARMGKNTLYFAAEGRKRSWFIKSEKRSNRYTTRWNELPIVFCR